MFEWTHFLFVFYTMCFWRRPLCLEMLFVSWGSTWHQGLPGSFSGFCRRKTFCEGGHIKTCVDHCPLYTRVAPATSKYNCRARIVQSRRIAPSRPIAPSCSSVRTGQSSVFLSAQHFALHTAEHSQQRHILAFFCSRSRFPLLCMAREQAFGKCRQVFAQTCFDNLPMECRCAAVFVHSILSHSLFHVMH